MGGSLAVTLILENGNMHKMERWTNTLPDFVNNLKFIQKDSKHVQNYLEAWFLMKSDWELNGPDGPFEQKMTKVYFPYFEMAPSGYGLVVIDMMKNKIYSQQSYDYPGKGSRNVKRIKRFYETGRMTKEMKERFERIQELENDGRIHVTYDEDGDQDFTIDMSPFEVTIFEQNKAGTLQFMERMNKEYGLNEKEKEIWLDYIEKLYYDEEE